MSRRISPVTLILTLALALAMPAAAIAVESGGATTAPAAPSTPDGSTDAAPLTLTPDEINALQEGAAGTDSSTGNESTLTKAGNFVSDNAPYFIIGIIVLAAILAGILIMRGRHRSAAAVAGTAAAGAVAAGSRGAPGTAADAPSATELRRRKRAAMQKAREEERLRRRAGKPGTPTRYSAPAGAAAVAGQAAQPVDAIAAEKQAARDQAQAAGAVARSAAAPAAGRPAAVPPVPGLQPSRTVPAPVSPSQTAPAAGIVTPAAVAAAAAAAPAQSTPPPAGVPASSRSSAPPQPVAPPQSVTEPDTQVDLPVAPPASPESREPAPVEEPPLAAPGPDAAVGKAAAVFAAGAAGGAIAGRASAPSPGPSDTQVREADGLLQAKVAEIKASQGTVADESEAAPEPKPKPESEPALEPRSAPVPELEPAARPEASEPESAVNPDPHLATIEQRLSQDGEARDRSLLEAEQRLRLIEQRAEDAERRAAFAEKLALLKIEEGERERRLHDVMSGIDRAEERTREAEERAEAAERAATAALEGTVGRQPAPSSDQAAPVSQTPFGVEPAAPAAKSVPERHPEPAIPLPPVLPPSAPALAGAINLNSASFEQLREADLSVTQATRILAYRERFGGYRSVEDLEKVPGFPADLIADLRDRLTV